MRVIAPVDGAYNFGYAGKFSRVAIPRGPGFDATYPTNAPGACDYFYDIPDGQRPWEAALDGEGRGLIQASTSRQRGRKLFVWGMGVGGRRWQEFLADKGCTYIEIQAGVARTQYECFPMAPESEVQWLEAYGLMEASPERVHSEDYADAWHAVQEHLDVRLPQERLEAMLVETDSASRRAPEAILHRGSGWGALERRRRERAGQKPFALPSLPFDDASLGEEQAPWLALLEQGALPTRAPAAEPGAWMVQAEWRAMLDASIQAGDSNHWLAWLHLGVMRYQAGDQEARARPGSNRCSRALAVGAAEPGRPGSAREAPGDAADLWLEAYQMVPTGAAGHRVLSRSHRGRSAARGAGAAGVDAAEVRHGRIRILEAQAALDADDLARVEAILMGDIEVPDVREGEVSLQHLGTPCTRSASPRPRECPSTTTCASGFAASVPRRRTSTSAWPGSLATTDRSRQSRPGTCPGRPYPRTVGGRGARCLPSGRLGGADVFPANGRDCTAALAAGSANAPGGAPPGGSSPGAAAGRTLAPPDHHGAGLAGPARTTARALARLPWPLPGGSRPVRLTLLE